MISYKFIAVVAFSLVMAGIQSGIINTCSNLGDKQPGKSSDCTSFNNSTDGTKCCYLSAQLPNTTNSVSLCMLLPNGTSETVIDIAAKALGNNSTYSCSSSYIAISSFIAMIFALLF